MALCSSLNPPAENRHELATQVTMPELVLEKDTIESGSSTPPRNMPTNLRELRKEETRNAITDGSTMTDALAPVPSVSPGTPPPDGGFWAWMAVASGFFVVMNTWGVFVSFGVFQTYYVTALERSSSDISWIGSFEVFLLFFVGTIGGILTDAGYFRSTVATGGILIVLGTFTTSASSAYWQVFLAQGVCNGLGSGLIFTPVMTLISTYFTTKRAVALAIAACGSTVGGLIFPSMARTLLPTIGFGWTMRAIGFIQMGTLALALVAMKPRVKPQANAFWVDWSAFKVPEYTLYAFGSFLAFVGVFFPIFYIASYARNVLGQTYTESLNLLLVLNGIGIIGRLAPSFVAPYVGALNLFICHVASTALIVYLWSTVTTLQGLYAWTVFFSLAMGGIQSLGPAALGAVRFDVQKQGTLIGMVYSVTAFGVLIGPPVSGALVSGGSWLNAQVFAATCMTAGVAVLVAAREVKRRRDSMGLWAKL